MAGRSSSNATGAFSICRTTTTRRRAIMGGVLAWATAPLAPSSALKVARLNPGAPPPKARSTAACSARRTSRDSSPRIKTTGQSGAGVVMGPSREAVQDPGDRTVRDVARREGDRLGPPSGGAQAVAGVSDIAALCRQHTSLGRAPLGRHRAATRAR